MTRPPASFRYNNPGAMYPGPSAAKFGSIGTEVIGGGHKIAVFDDPVKGAAAQFDLLSRSYAGMPLSQAIAKWSGGNSSPAYAAQIARTLGIDPNAILSPELLGDPSKAVPLAKAMAQWEAGQPYPLSDEQWASAHGLAKGGTSAPSTPSPMPFALSPMATAEAPLSAVPAQQAGLSLPFGLSLGGGDAQAPELDLAPLPGKSKASSLRPLDMRKLAAFAAERRKLGV